MLCLGRCVHRNRSRRANQNNHKLIVDKLWSVSVRYEHNPTLIRRSCLACSTRLSSALFFWSVFWSWQWIFSLQREAKQRHQDVFFLSTSDLRVSFCLVYFPNDYCRWLWTKASFDPGIHVVRYPPSQRCAFIHFFFSHNNAYNSRSINIFDVWWFAVSLEEMNWLVVRMDFRSLGIFDCVKPNQNKREMQQANNSPAN